MFDRLVTPVAEHPTGAMVVGDAVLENTASGGGRERLRQILTLIDGTHDWCQIRDMCDLTEQEAQDLRETLLGEGLLEFVPGPMEALTGWDAALEIEDFIEDRLHLTLYRNIFWQHAIAHTLPHRVMEGMVIENYHFLFRESYFDAPVLSYQSFNALRLSMNEFYSEEYGHDEILLRALNSIAISREDLFRTVPLPGTQALCNTLAYWSNTDPMAFFLTLGVLEGKDVAVDSFVHAMENQGVEESFVKPVRTHALINQEGAHGSLTRELLGNIPLMPRDEVDRLKARLYVFIELYDGFFTNVWDYYGQSDAPLRLINDFHPGFGKEAASHEVTH